MKIISIDGGGIRGILPARILERLYLNHQVGVDLFAGTSTGGIIALGLASGLQPRTIFEFYWNEGPKVFAKPSIVRKVTGGLFNSQYENKLLKKALVDVFGEKKLKDLEHKVLIPTFDLDYQGFFRSWKPKFFTNFDPIDGEELVVDVAMRTSAAPTYFPSYQGYVDGGLVANNPSMAALAQALNEGSKLEDISILSLSTGRTHQYISGMSLDWGLSRWLRHLVTVLFEGMVDIADYQCQRILRERYLRVDTMLKQNISLDDADGIADIVKIADEIPIDDVEDFMYDHKFYLGVPK